MWGIMWRGGSHMFWGGEGGLQPGAWAAPRAGPRSSEGKAVERFSICLSGCQPQGLGWSLIVCIWEAQRPHCVCTRSQRQSPRLVRRGRWAGRSLGWGARWEGQVHLASDTGANWPERWALDLPSVPPSLPAMASPAPSTWVSQRGQTPSAAASHSPAPPAHPACFSFTDPLLPEQPRWLPTSCFKSALHQGR